MSHNLLLCVVALPLFLAPPAVAAPPATPAAKEGNGPDARALNSEAQTEYDLGHYRKALDLYESLYKLRPLPALLFNIAQCHRKLGELKEAANTYRSFIVYAEPGSGEMRKAQELLAQVELALSQGESATKVAPNETFQSTTPRERPPAPPVILVTAPPTPPPAAAAAPPAPAPAPAVVVSAPQKPAVRSHTTSYVLGGIGVAALAGGSVLGLVSMSAGNELSSGPHSRAEVDSLSSTKSGGAKAADVLFVVALGLGVGAVLAW